MIGTNIDFASSTKPLWTGKITICSTSRLKLLTYFGDITNNTLFNLEQEKNRPSKKILIFFHRCSRIIVFINNWEELDDIKDQLNSELNFNEEWTLYNKNKWEGLNGSTSKDNINQ